MNFCYLHWLFLHLIVCGGLLCDAQDGAGKSDPSLAKPQMSNLPAWVEQGTTTDGSDTLLVVQTKRPFHSPIEADSAIDPAIRHAIQQYFLEVTGNVNLPLEMSVSEISTKLLVPGTRIVRPYDEVYSAELAARYGLDHGTFYRGFAQLRLSEAFVTQYLREVQTQRVRYRLKLAASGGIGFLMLLGIVFGYFRIDHATRGFYSRRLQAVSVIAALVVVLSVYWLLIH